MKQQQIMRAIAELGSARTLLLIPQRTPHSWALRFMDSGERPVWRSAGCKMRSPALMTHIPVVSEPW